MRFSVEFQLCLDFANRTSFPQSQLKGFKLAMTDVRTYVLALAYMCITGAAGFQNFFPTLVSSPPIIRLPNTIIY